MSASPFDSLSRFSTPTRTWFEGAFATPTAVQDGAWRVISQQRHALVVAPTGSGKTLAAFLWALDRLHTQQSNSQTGTKVLYISPLKALGVDVQRNLRSPLIGIAQTAKRLGMTVPEITVGIRSGDTPAQKRRQLVAHPPDILITTPESLYLMLTSQARSTLQAIHTVIVDEVHALAGTKRGAHLAVSLERLDQLLPAPAQRIGLSATVEPVETVARFLGGSAPVDTVQPASEKNWELTLSVPVPDMATLGGPNTYGEGDNTFEDPVQGDQREYQASIWPHVEERIVDLVEKNRSTIVFANSRGLAEKLTARLNEVHAARLHDDSQTNPPPLARAHHGSVSKDQRTLIEESLKSGVLRCVVATSSLELGIDMGSVDLVIQVQTPPSVASGLQRLGRAGHRVGGVSRGFLYPKHRGDLLTATVTAQRMLAGEIEPIHIPTNPLDILAQQTVAVAALGPVDVESWFEALRRTAPFATLPRSAFEATLDLVSGRYPSDEFAELRPRVVWDRDAGVIEGRPGAQRTAVTSGGTIPDRGLYPVYIVGVEDSKAPKRVGELDEEMVYESRAGDVIALGASSWRIEDISHDRVSVTPAPGMPGKLPFWHGEGPGRPVALGRAVGNFTDALAASLRQDRDAFRKRLNEVGLDDWAVDNLLAYVDEQAQATGMVPSATRFVVERFRDEIGDWRVVLHSPLGKPVHAPWALAVAARAEELFGVDASAMAADDGIVLRIPSIEAEPPGADLFFFEPDELEDLITERVASSALFASRFRENAARALLLPRRDPGRRTPLWQQRQRSAQLLDVARKFKNFPIILETVRECLQDVYDLPALIDTHTKIGSRAIKVTEVETETPSPFARTLLFDYVAHYLYEGDSPLAERRAAALSLDSSLLSELLGKEELRELLEPEIIRCTEARLQHTASGYRFRGLEGAADLLRLLGPLTTSQLAARLRSEDTTEDTVLGQLAGGVEQAEAIAQSLVAENRALIFQLRGKKHYAAIEDAARLRDGLGIPLPMGVPLAFLEPVPNPLADLVGRYARTHAPFTAAQAAEALGLGTAVIETTLKALATERRVISGEFLPEEIRTELALIRTGSPSPAETEWVDTGVLRTLRARSLAALRADVEPVTQRTYGLFLPGWQHLQSWLLTEEKTGSAAGTASVDESRFSVRVTEKNMLSGYDGLLTVIDQLAGVPIPASALESLVLSLRISDYSPALLDQAMSSGEVIWTGAGKLAGDGWVRLHLAEAAALTLPTRDEREKQLAELGHLDTAIYRALDGGGLFFPQIRTILAAEGLDATAAETSAALWRLVWAGLISNDTFAPVRAYLAGKHPAHRLKKPTPTPRTAIRRGAGRLKSARFGATSEVGRISPTEAGRWSQIQAETLNPTEVAAAYAELLVDRYGVLTRGAVAAENALGGFSAAYRVLSAAEEKGVTRRGYFIEGLGGAQFSTANTVDWLRDCSRAQENNGGLSQSNRTVVLLAATDPANPYGATLPWPAVSALGQDEKKPGRHRPGRRAGAVVVLADGAPVLYLERGGRTVLLFTDNPDDAAAAAPLLGELVRRGAAEKLIIEKVNGLSLLEQYPPILADSGEKKEHPLTALRRSLLTAGFYSTPRGLRMRRAL